MKKNKKSIQLASPRTLFAALVAVLVLSPSWAMAEEVGASILIPHAAEFVPALVAFLIIWVVLAKFFWPQVLENMEKRQQKIQDDLDQAEKTKIEAQTELEAYKAKISEAERKAEEIVAQAKKDAEGERARICEQAQAQANEIISRAHEAVENERKSVMVDLVNQAADLSVTMAEKILEENLDPKKQHELIDKYLQEVGNLNVK